MSGLRLDLLVISIDNISVVTFVYVELDDGFNDTVSEPITIQQA